MVKDANEIVVAAVYCRDDPEKWSFGHSKLTSEEARRIAAAIVYIPEFVVGGGFYTRSSGNYHWCKARPLHVAFEDGYIRSHGDGIKALCKFNGIPFDTTGETRDSLCVPTSSGSSSTP